MYNNNKQKLNIMKNFITENKEMLNDLLQYANAVNFKMNNEDDLKKLLINWVNHRVDLTPQMLDYMYNDYISKIN